MKPVATSMQQTTETAATTTGNAVPAVAAEAVEAAAAVRVSAVAEVEETMQKLTSCWSSIFHWRRLVERRFRCKKGKKK